MLGPNRSGGPNDRTNDWALVSLTVASDVIMCTSLALLFAQNAKQNKAYHPVHEQIGGKAQTALLGYKRKAPFKNVSSICRLLVI